MSAVRRLLLRCIQFALILELGAATAIELSCAEANDHTQCAVLQAFCNGDPTASTFCSSAASWAAAASGTATDYCTFAGVTCDQSNNVVGLCVAAQHAVLLRLRTHVVVVH